MPKYQLTVLTPEGSAIKDSVDAIVAPGRDGTFGVLADHAPMIVAVAKGVLKINVADAEKYYAVGSGILEVHPQHDVLILVDRAETCSSIEDAKEKSAGFEARW